MKSNKKALYMKVKVCLILADKIKSPQKFFRNEIVSGCGYERVGINIMRTQYIF